MTPADRIRARFRVKPPEAEPRTACWYVEFDLTDVPEVGRVVWLTGHTTEAEALARLAQFRLVVRLAHEAEI